MSCTQVEAGELARRQLVQADVRIADLDRQLAASRDATREAESHLQQERARHGPAESTAELKQLIASLQRDATTRQAKLDKATAGLEKMAALQAEANSAFKQLQVSSIFVQVGKDTAFRCKVIHVIDNAPYASKLSFIGLQADASFAPFDIGTPCGESKHFCQCSLPFGTSCESIVQWCLDGV